MKWPKNGLSRSKTRFKGSRVFVCFRCFLTCCKCGKSKISDLCADRSFSVLGAAQCAALCPVPVLCVWSAVGLLTELVKFWKFSCCCQVGRTEKHQPRLFFVGFLRACFKKATRLNIETNALIMTQGFKKSWLLAKHSSLMLKMRWRCRC